MECSPQRFLAGDRDVIRNATLTPSSVLPVTNQVRRIPTARDGSGAVDITGTYTGNEPATYDFEILDDDVEDPIVSKPIFSGVGSGELQNIATSLPAQDITVELNQSGLPLLYAAVDFEGATIKARAGGTPGNAIYFDVDQSPLTFTPQSYSLLNDLAAGSGGATSPMTGSEFDFNTKVMGADGKIPADAHRISFGTDRTNIYLQYKKYIDGKWNYYLVPELKVNVPRGTVINFVTGGRTVTVYGGGSPPEAYTGIVTLYDLLIAIRTGSAILDVATPVANDRAPDGQAAHELQTRTDAYYLPSSGTGNNAIGFEGVSVEPDAGTQLVIATCRAVTSADHPLAGIGRTRWELASSTLGALGTIIEGVAFVGDEFGLTVPVRTPFEFGTQKGRFTVVEKRYQARAPNVEPPPICPVGLVLGPDAVDQTITLTWTKRPSGACLCEGMPAPGVDSDCLGTIDEGGAAMAYSAEARSRLEDLYDWAEDLITACSRYVPGHAFDGIPEYSPVGVSTGNTATTTRTSNIPGVVSHSYSQGTFDGWILQDKDPVDTTYADVAVPPDFQACIDFYETGIVGIDGVTNPTDKAAGFAEWDIALQTFKDDLSTSPLGSIRLASIAFDKYRVMVKRAMAYAGIAQLGGANASAVESGDGCWRDLNKDFWEVVGSDKGAYAPAFNGARYYSSRRASDADAYFSTHEFSFVINVQCPQGLLYGDQIVLSIGGAAWPAMYQIGDQLVLPIIGAQNLYLAGGQNASLVQTWNVNASVSGPLPSFSYDPNAPADYDSGTLSFTLAPGGIPFASGDRFVMTIEGGHYRWRKNGGAWNAGSPAYSIPQGPLAFDSGLSVEFTPGAAPSFVAGDVYSFLALQPWAASNLQNPNVEPWKWSGASASMIADCGEVVQADITAFVHTLPEGSTLTIEGGVVAGVYDWGPEAVTWRPQLIAHLFAAVRSFRYLRLTPASATGGAIQWWAAAMAFATRRSADVTPMHKYAMADGDGGLYGRRVFLGKGQGAEVVWPDGELSEPDRLALVAMLDHVKENHDEPLIFLSQVTRPSEAMFVRVAEDEVVIHDRQDGNRDVAFDRDFDARLTLAPVLQ